MKLSLFALVSLLIISGCSPKSPKSESTVRIRFPEAARAIAAKSSVTAMAFDWTRACFIVNVTGEGIPSETPLSCDVKTGVFKGTVAPGGELSLTIPGGKSRKLEVFAFERMSSTDTCPTLTTQGFGALARARIARVGEVQSFDALEESVTLNVGVTAPVAGVSVITQYSLPATCVAEAAPSPMNGEVVIGGAKLVGATYSIQGIVHAKSKYLKGSNYSIRLQRGEQ